MRAFCSVAYCFVISLSNTAPLAAQHSQTVINSLVLACDTLSAHPEDHLSTVPGVAWEDLNVRKASEPCEELLRSKLFTGKLMYQLARLLDKTGNPETVNFLKFSIEEFQYPMAYYHMGVLYEDGLYVDEFYQTALEYYREGFERGSLHSGKAWMRYAGELAEHNPYAYLGYWRALQALSAAGHTPADEKIASERTRGAVDLHNKIFPNNRID